MKILKILTIVFYILPLALFIILYNDIPNYIQLHWGMSEANPVLQPKFLLLIIMLPVYPLFYFPMKKIEDEKSKNTMLSIHFLSTLIISALAILIIINSLGIVLPVIEIIGGLGFLIVICVIYFAIKHSNSESTPKSLKLKI